MRRGHDHGFQNRQGRTMYDKPRRGIRHDAPERRRSDRRSPAESSPEVGQGAVAVVGDARGSEGSLVDRLAARYEGHTSDADNLPDLARDAARFFLLAIADELDDMTTSSGYETVENMNVADRLRAEARATPEETQR